MGRMPATEKPCMCCSAGAIGGVCRPYAVLHTDAAAQPTENWLRSGFLMTLNKGTADGLDRWSYLDIVDPLFLGVEKWSLEVPSRWRVWMGRPAAWVFYDFNQDPTKEVFQCLSQHAPFETFGIANPNAFDNLNVYFYKARAQAHADFPKLITEGEPLVDNGHFPGPPCPNAQ